MTVVSGRIIICADCGQERPHGAKGRCTECYDRARHRAGGELRLGVTAAERQRAPSPPARAPRERSLAALATPRWADPRRWPYLDDPPAAPLGPTPADYAEATAWLARNRGAGLAGRGAVRNWASIAPKEG